MYFYYYLRYLKHQRWGVKSCNPLISFVTRQKKEGLNLAGSKLRVWFKFFPPVPLFAKSFFHCWESLELRPITCVDKSLEKVISPWLRRLGTQGQGPSGCVQCWKTCLSLPWTQTGLVQAEPWPLLTLFLKLRKVETLMTWALKMGSFFIEG